ncbi:hypothetical protein ACTXT7_003342 [Hymenolepis weldensis]
MRGKSADFTVLPVLAALGGAGFALYFSNKLYFSGSKCYETGRLDGKLVIVTGTNTGIGKETTAELARRGANVIMACRNMDRAEATKSDILTNYNKENPEALIRNALNSKISEGRTPVHSEQLMIEKLDLSSLPSVQTFVDHIREKGHQVDILINNARPSGVVVTDILRNAKLLDCIRKFIPRVLNYRFMDFYAQTWICKTTSEESIAANIGQPTLIFRLGRPFLKTCWEGAQTTFFTALTPNLNSGHYYTDRKGKAPHPLVFDQHAQEELVTVSPEAVRLE